MPDEEKKENAPAPKKKEKKGLAREIDKLKTWVDRHQDDIKTLGENLGEGKDVLRQFVNACLSGKPELAKEALTEFEDVNELILNQAELEALGTGPDIPGLLSVVWKGVSILAKIAGTVGAIAS